MPGMVNVYIKYVLIYYLYANKHLECEAPSKSAQAQTFLFPEILINIKILSQ